MSVIADFYVSAADHAIVYDNPDEQATFLRARHNGITPLEVSTLWAAINGRAWDVAIMEEFECVLERDRGERLIHQLPHDFLTDLVAVPVREHVALLAAWA